MEVCATVVWVQSVEGGEEGGEVSKQPIHTPIALLRCTEPPDGCRANDDAKQFMVHAGCRFVQTKCSDQKRKRRRRKEKTSANK